MNDHRPEKTIGILCAIVRVIPTSPIKPRLKRVIEVLTRSDWTLPNGRHTIEPRGVSLQETMPVHRGSLRRICNSVLDSDSESITPICLNERCGELPVHEQKTLVETIRSFSTSCDGKAVVSAHVCNWNVTLVRVGIWSSVVLSGCRVEAIRSAIDIFG